MIRTEANWGRKSASPAREELVEKHEPGIYTIHCPWCDLDETLEGTSRGEALEKIADHILEDHA